MWPRRDLLDLLRTEHPIIQAPMAGAATPALAAAVSNAGGLGSLGCATLSTTELREAVDALRGRTNRPFNLNFFVHETPRRRPDVEAATATRLAPFYEERGLGAPPTQAAAPFPSFTDETLAAVLDLRPAVVSFHFGMADPAQLAAIRESGAAVLATATTVAEAVDLEAKGVDAVIAQGWEAGGHRGSFRPTEEDVGIGTMALVPQIADAIDRPVIAAGGIADGRGIAAAFNLGASGVQMGTAFLSCPEAGIGDRHREALAASRDEDTRLTRAFSGRPARARKNRYIDTMAQERVELPDFPTMYALSGPLTQSSGERGDDDFLCLLYGQAAPLNRELPASELVRLLAEEARNLLPATR